MTGSGAPKAISLALQGGGSHGAFEWGLIERLLEDDRLEIRAVTAASGGAMNAAALASGLATGGRAGAAKTLTALWRAVSDSDSRNTLGDSGLWSAMMTPPAWLQNTPAGRWAQGLTTTLSPYEFNPFNLNPLREAIDKTLDFKAIREQTALALYVSATGVRTGKTRIFRETEITADTLLASACLPTAFQAVEVDGEPYWDGGYMANPALWPLFYDPTPDDILIISLNPFRRADVPKTPGEIMDRLNEITFNASLSGELRAIAFVQKLLTEGLLTESARGRYRNMLVHAIMADGRLDDLTMASKFDTDWDFLQGLRARGRKAGEEWLKESFADIGVRSTVDLKAFL